MALRFQKKPSEENNLAMGIRRERATERKEPAPDLTDFMNDWFFGSANKDHGSYNLTGVNSINKDCGLSKTNTSKLTQEWLDEAKKMVSSSPSRHASPSRSVTSPRFLASSGKEPSALLEGRDPLSRSARRHRLSSVGVSDEILQRSSARHSRNFSEGFLPEPAADHPRLPHILKPPTPADRHTSDDSNGVDAPALLPPRQPFRRKSRFQDAEPPSDQLPLRRTFRTPSPTPPEGRGGPQLALSPPRNLVESAHRRSVSSSTCSLDKLSRSSEAERGLNPRRSVSVPSEMSNGYNHGRFVSISSDTCGRPCEGPEVDEDVKQINSFLRRQRAMITRISRGEESFKAKIILSGTSSSTMTSMVAAICYAWLLENKEEEEDGVVVVPVMNLQRGRMCMHKQVAWLFHHIGIDASALLFSDEVDLEGMIMARQLSILVVGQDVLKTNNEVGSQFTVLTDNYCEDAYNLLQSPNLKKLLLAGILLDTQNLNNVVKFSTNRDAEAVQLLLVDSASSFRNEFYGQLMQDHKDTLFLEALRHNYGMLSNEDNSENGAPQECIVPVAKSTSSMLQEVKKVYSAKQTKKSAPSPASVATSGSTPTPPRAPATASTGKNKFFLAKWFGFGSK